jgi:hypothetical protein
VRHGGVDPVIAVGFVGSKSFLAQRTPLLALPLRRSFVSFHFARSPDDDDQRFALVDHSN